MTWQEKLKRQFDENPIGVIGIGALVVGSAAKLIDAWSAAKGRKAYAKQIDYKVSRGR